MPTLYLSTQNRTEEKFLAEGYGVKRYPVMYNDFILVGPRSDPAGVNGTKDVVEPRLRLSRVKQAPCSYHAATVPDTNQAELQALARQLKIAIAKDKGALVSSNIGQGMGATLNMPRAAWMLIPCPTEARGFLSRTKANLVIAVEGDKRLFNQYGVMLVNPQKHPSVKKELGQQFIDWLVSPEGQKAIADYKIDGQQLFYPNANDPSA